MGVTTYELSDFTTLLATEYSANAAIPANTDAGSTLGAIFNADALLALVIQQEVLHVQGVTRLSTSFGADCDTFGEPFSFERIGNSSATGEVLCSTATPVTSQLVVPVGGVLGTIGGLQFTIIANTDNPFYDAMLGGYTISPVINPTNVSVSVQCTIPGIIGNVSAGQINQIIGGVGIPITGIATVTNTTDFDNGVDDESDAQYKQRFAIQESTGEVATENAVVAAILKIQVGLTVSNGDLKHKDGTSWPTGGFSIIVNALGQNTGPSDTLLSAANEAIMVTKALGVPFELAGPNIVTVDASALVVCQPGVASATVVQALDTAYTTFVNNIGLDINGGATRCAISQVYAILQAVPGVAYIDGLQLNGGSSDITAGFATQLVAGTPSFTT